MAIDPPVPGSAPGLRIQAIAWRPDTRALATALTFLNNAARIARQSNLLGTVEVAYGCLALPAANDQDALRRRFEALSVSFIAVADTQGLAGAHNQLLGQARSDLTLLLQADALVSPNLLAALMQALQRDGVGLAEARQLPIDLPKHVDPSNGATDWASHRCLLGRTSLFHDLGGFDSEAFPHVGFDVDLSWRARQAGHRIVHCGDAVVWCDTRLGADANPTAPEHDRAAAAEALLALAAKYRSADLIARNLGAWQTSADPALRCAADAFVARRTSGRLPAGIADAGDVARFEDAALDPYGLLVPALEAAAPASEGKRAPHGGDPGPAQPPLATFLRQIIDQTDQSARISRLARAYLEEDTAPRADAQPFLTVITRTQGLRIIPLQDTLMSLAGQTCADFEVLIVCHRCDATRAAEAQNLVAAFPASLRERVTILRCETPGRAAPINLAFTHARGRYAAVLDDDDLVFAHWVESFRRLAGETSGTLLRALCVKQHHLAAHSAGVSYPMPRSRPSFAWPRTYNVFDHLVKNDTPFMSIAFPATAFREMGMRLDETLETTEDWDFITRCALLLGVRSSTETTALYRWWTEGQSSLLTITAADWEGAISRIQGRLNAGPLLLPAGTIEYLLQRRADMAERDKLALRNDWLAAHLVPLGTEFPWVENDPRLNDLSRAVLLGLVRSTSWRITRPLRALARRLGFDTVEASEASIPAAFAERQQLIRAIHASRAWRWSAPLRSIMTLLAAPPR